MSRIKLQMKKIHSGLLRVYPSMVRNFEEMIDQFEEKADTMDYMVGWVDCFASGKGSIGRGEMHFAEHLEPGEDAAPAQTLRVQNQELPPTILGFFPKVVMWRFMKPFVNNLGMQMINLAKVLAGKRPGGDKAYLQSHVAFSFLLDFVPEWKRAYSPGGLIQYQSFVPRKHAARVFAEQLRLSQRRGLVPYLGVTKKHVSDDFLISHGVDGYSLALDYAVTERNRKDLWRLCHEMDEVVLAAGGRFYFAKDSTMRAGTPNRYLPPESIRKFQALKAQCDPEGLLSTDLYRRVFGIQDRKAEATAAQSHVRIGRIAEIA